MGPTDSRARVMSAARNSPLSGGSTTGLSVTKACAVGTVMRKILVPPIRPCLSVFRLKSKRDDRYFQNGPVGVERDQHPAADWNEASTLR